MTKKESFRKAMRSYIKMGEHLKKFIGARSKSTLLGMKRADDYNLYITETVLEGARRKMRGNKIKSGRKPVCHRIKQ